MIRLLLAVFCLTFWTSNLPADIVYVKKGTPAPFSGQLLSQKDAAKLALKASECPELLDLEKQQQKALCAIDVEAKTKTLQLKLDLEKQRVNYLKLEVERVSPDWWERPEFIVPVTIILCLGVSVGIMKVVQ
jgi:hypothetical protein